MRPKLIYNFILTIIFIPNLVLCQIYTRNGVKFSVKFVYQFERVPMSPRELYIRKSGFSNGIKAELNFQKKNGLALGIEYVNTKFTEKLQIQNPPVGTYVTYFHERKQFRFPLLFGIELMKGHRMILFYRTGFVLGFVKNTATKAITASGIMSNFVVSGKNLGKNISVTNQIELKINSFSKRLGLNMHSYLTSIIKGYEYQNVNNKVGMDWRYYIGVGLGIQYLLSL